MEEQLILHYAAEDDAPTYYSVNWRSAYHLARHTNIVELVNARYGEQAGIMIGNILQLGHARVGDLADAYDLSPGSKRDSGIDTNGNHTMANGMVNGASKASAANSLHVTTANEFHGTLRTLLRSGVLVKVGMRAYVPPSDLQEQMEEVVISEQFPDRKINGPKKQNEFKLAINSLKRKWRGEDAFSDLRDGGSRGTIKRPGDRFNANNKRVKLNGNTANGVPDGEQPVEKLPVLCCCSSSRVLSLINNPG